MASIVPAGNAAAPIQLNPYISEVPEKNANQLRCKALALNTLAVITTIAIVAIVGAVLAVSLGLGALTGTLPFILVGLAIATPFLAMGASKLKSMANEYSENHFIEKGVADELKLIANWKTAEIEQFFAEKGLPHDQLPLDALRMINPQEPLCALLPLIARYNFNSKQAVEFENKAKEGFANNTPDPGIKLNARRLAWERHESDAIPHALKAALMLQIISQPYLQYRNVGEFGAFSVKHFDQRLFDRQFDQEDTYFAFNDVQRAPITLTEIEQVEMDPQALRQKLFLVRA